MNAMPKNRASENPVEQVELVAPNAAVLAQRTQGAKRAPSVTHVVTIFLFVLVSLFSGAEILSVLQLRPFPHGRSLALGALAFAFLLPDLAIYALLISLPLFGNKPATPQFQYLLLVQCSVFLGLLARHLLSGRVFSERAEVQKNTIWTLMVAYGFASFLSLSSLPLGVLGGELRSSWPGFSAPGLAANILAFASLAEDKQSYAILSAMLTLLAVGIGGLVLARARLKPQLPYRAGLSILFGLFLSLVFGLLDYYRVIDLRAIRGLDPTVNPGNAQFRLQSFFGHSGWYAEYVTLTVPFAVLLLAQRLPFWLRVTECLLVLLVGEYTLILTYQRGGWISYPLTLFAIWAAIYVVKRLEAGEQNVVSAVRKSFLKVCLSLPLTVLLSLGCINLGMRSGLFSGEVQTTVDSYISRFEDIQKTSDRTDFMIAGFKIGALHPILGAGSESFGFQFHKEFELPTGHYPGEFVLPLHGTAHTLYFQIFSGKGVVGITLLMLLVACTIVPAMKSVIRDHEGSLDRKIFLLSVVCFCCSFLIYGVVQEIFYIQNLQILFFAVLGLAAAVLSSERLELRETRLLWAFLGGLFALHLFWEKQVYAMMDKRPDDSAGLYGCYQAEVGADGRAYRWCGRHAKMLLLRKRDADGAYAELRLGVDFLSEGLSQAPLRVSVDGSTRVETAVAALQEKTLRIPLDPRDPLRRTPQGLSVVVEIESDSYFIPQFVFKSGNDYRVLSYRIYP